MVKLDKASGPDFYNVMQGKRDKVLDQIIATLIKHKIQVGTLWITNGGTYKLSQELPIDQPYTKYFDWYISAGERKSAAKTQ